jgi:hypothetical protein
MTPFLRGLLTILIFFPLVSPVMADANSEWAAIVAMDSGPKRKPQSKEEAVLLARNHLLMERNALEKFLKTYPSDERAPAAKMRLAGVLATEGNMDGDPRQLDLAMKLLAAVESDPRTDEKVRVDAAFRRTSIVMQSAKPTTSQGIKTIVAAAKSFATEHPRDIRSARLLVEAATVCDSVPQTKRALLEEARSLTKEDELKARIADDMSRLDRLGRTLDLSLPGLDGGTIDLKSFRGSQVLVVFWASESPQSLLWLHDLRREWDKLGASAPKVVAVSMDRSSKEAAERARSFPKSWSVAFEEGGWESPTARKLGINALPTVWAVDRNGVLESLNAKTSWKSWISSGTERKAP